MIFPVAHTFIAKESIGAIAQASGFPSPIKSRDILTPAFLCRSLALRSEKGDVYELGHFTVSFYIDTTEMMALVSLSDVRVLEIREGSYIFTHNILGWRDLIVKGMVKSSSSEVRKVLNFILAYLRDNGFDDLFSEYRRANLVLDQTLYLEKL